MGVQSMLVDFRLFSLSLTLYLSAHPTQRILSSSTKHSNLAETSYSVPTRGKGEIPITNCVCVCVCARAQARMHMCMYQWFCFADIELDLQVVPEEQTLKDEFWVFLKLDLWSNQIWSC